MSYAFEEMTTEYQLSAKGEEQMNNLMSKLSETRDLYEKALDRESVKKRKELTQKLFDSANEYCKKLKTFLGKTLLQEDNALMNAYLEKYNTRFDLWHNRLQRWIWE